MRSSLPPATKAQKYRMGVIKREIGCIACIKLLWTYLVPAHAHHLISEETGKQISHDHTIPLCDPHHVGTELSIHKTKKLFAEKVGTDEELLEETNRLYNKIRANTIGGTHQLRSKS